MHPTNKILFDGGYAQATAVNKTTKDKFAFYYYNQDHLGNNREVVNAKGVVQQVTNYYPFGAPYADVTASKGADVQPYKYNKQKGKNLQPTFHYSSIIKMRIQTKKISYIWNIHRFYNIHITCILCFCMSHTIMAQKVVSDNLLFINHPKYGLKCMGFADTTVVCKKLIFPDSILINGKNYPITNYWCPVNISKRLKMMTFGTDKPHFPIFHRLSVKNIRLLCMLYEMKHLHFLTINLF